jgi:hypothetical protein
LPPLHGADPGTVIARDGRLMLRDQPNTGESYSELLQRNFLADVEALGSWVPPGRDTPYGLMTFGAQFAGASALNYLDAMALAAAQRSEPCASAYNKST